MELTVKTLRGTTLNVTLPSSATVLELKSAIAVREGLTVPLTALRLIFNGRQLTNARRLREYEVNPTFTANIPHPNSTNPDFSCRQCGSALLEPVRLTCCHAVVCAHCHPTAAYTCALCNQSAGAPEQVSALFKELLAKTILTCRCGSALRAAAFAEHTRNTCLLSQATCVPTCQFTAPVVRLREHQLMCPHALAARTEEWILASGSVLHLVLKLD